MKILILTSTADVKMHFIIDKIVSYNQAGEESIVRMLDGSVHYVKESAEFITQQLVSAAVNSYIIYNSEENK